MVPPHHGKVVAPQGQCRQCANTPSRRLQRNPRAVVNRSSYSFLPGASLVSSLCLYKGCIYMIVQLVLTPRMHSEIYMYDVDVDAQLLRTAYPFQ